jgi:hypothetical protein
LITVAKNMSPIITHLNPVTFISILFKSILFANKILSNSNNYYGL